ncbi:N-acetylmuramoyl-L-alanine amidase [Paracoccus indicus]|uniref:N-acetylmuramoyl-L-alanine amidase n=1 Tax=Paracoccus indicus TaxID=2079229 RepID=UPI000D3B32B1|nr:N-acetylmuramoyl-L-alanine amidase [Paracoccus indicus]
MRSWHRAKGWREIGYHWVIDRNGKVLVGRPDAETGAHAVDRNPGTIGICLLNGYGSAATDPFGADYTPQQDMTLCR